MKVYIHGANASPVSWNFIRNQIGDGILISYNSTNSFKNNLAEMKTKLQGMSELQFIAHSLGGIYSIHLANYFKFQTNCAITLSTPYGGHNIPYIARYMFNRNQLFSDILPNNWPISSINDIPLPCPWCNIVTTDGNVPWIFEPNDGVVTIRSQKHRRDMKLIELKLNHYEVILSQQVVDIIKYHID